MYDWGEAFAALDLVIKPTIDSLLSDSLAALAAENGDELLSLLLAEFHRDADRSKDWTAELVRYAVANNPENAAVLTEWVAAWTPAADALAAAYAPLLTGADPATVVAAAAKARADLLAAAGL